jgi:hypothetical protein
MALAMRARAVYRPTSVTRTGAEVVNAGPRVGGMFTLFLSELPLYLAIIWRLALGVDQEHSRRRAPVCSARVPAEL